jgi:hypothetical protein
VTVEGTVIGCVERFDECYVGEMHWMQQTVELLLINSMAFCDLTLSNPIFLPPAYSPAVIYFGREIGWWVTCNYPTVLKEKNINRNRKSITCAICWLKSVLHEEKRREP